MTATLLKRSLTQAERMTALARSFPSVAYMIDTGLVPGLDPWDPSRFLSWLNNPNLYPNRSLMAALVFIRWVGNPQMFTWDMHYAWSVWDAECQAAYKEWAENPWWA